MIAAKEPQKVLDNCVASAKEALNQLDVDVLDIIEV